MAHERPLRILSLDGGGVRGLSCLMMLRGVMEQIANDEGIENPEEMRLADYFDLICGTSTGGLIAILLGRLRLTTKDAIKQYRDLAKTIFGKERGMSMGGLRMSKGGETRYDASILKQAIQDVVQEKTGDLNARMYEPPPKEHGQHYCRVSLLAVIADVLNGEPHLFTTYERNDHTTIWEAARATSAATGYFEEMHVGNPPVRYVDAGLGYNNPSEEAYEEAKKRWPGRPIGVFLSMGTGAETEASLPDNGGWFGLGKQAAEVKALIQLTTSANRVHNKLFRRFKCEQDAAYFRFNVEVGLDKVGLDEWNKESKLASCTTSYFQNPEIEEKKELCATRLRQLTGTAKSVVVSADDFSALHEGDADNPGQDLPNMQYWYREQVGESGYPDSVSVNSKFQDPAVRPPGKTILSLRAIPNLQLRGQAFDIPSGGYRVRWIVWLWAGKGYPVEGARDVPVAHFTENSVVERIFPCKNPKDTLPGPDKLFWFPWGLRFSVGRAKVPGYMFKNSGVDVVRHPVIAPELLQPGFQEFRLTPGLWNTFRNKGWCEFGDEIVDVNKDGHLAFVIANWEADTFVKTFGGFSFAGVRLEPVIY